jgi:hypothetical protein
VGFGNNEAALASLDAAELQSNKAACGAAEILRDNFPDWGFKYTSPSPTKNPSMLSHGQNRLSPPYGIIHLVSGSTETESNTVIQRRRL